MVETLENSYRGILSYLLFALRPVLMMKSEYVCRRDMPGIEMFFILRGKIRQRRPDETARTLSAGIQFEEYALLAPEDEKYRYHTCAIVSSPQAQLFSFSRIEFQYVFSLFLVNYFGFRNINENLGLWRTFLEQRTIICRIFSVERLLIVIILN